MDYPLENLGPERFQRVCQALLAREFPSARLLPVGQPDGGRDAFAAFTAGGNRRSRETIVFQVKFARSPAALKDARKWVQEVVADELPKVRELVSRGVTRYRLITNVGGSAHLDSGSIDKLDAELARLPIPADAWWRDDLQGRLDDAWDIKWSFPELFTGPDLLRALVETGLTEERERRGSAIQAFLSEQYEDDSKVKFKQVELENQLLDLFVDVPLTPRTSQSPKKRRVAALVGAIGRSHSGFTEVDAEAATWVGFEDEYWDPHGSATAGAAQFLLHDMTCVFAPRIVLEGAPGQGKSTVSQYICQIHRMRLLNRRDDFGSVSPAHLNGPLRLPFRVDLRDLAAWLHGRNPFGDAAESLPARRSLETLLAAQVEQASGGATFSVSDLQAVIRVSSTLLALDGLDEVADIEERRKVVDEVTRAVGRFQQLSPSTQVVITSRPAAFENSPGFSEDKFVLCELASLTGEAISHYAERWIKARGLRAREAADVRRVLKDRLAQPHMRELARNPMQLAILLSLVHRRGPSLPDKRTALYDSYVNTFFDREAEKTPNVQTHRDLLIEIHQFLAWVLQTEAERGNSQGSISELRLREVLAAYLRQQDKDVSLVDVLFQSLVERVVAIVSRVQGTYEFEVQPLREYFAARYLYDTAPYSPPGGEAAGDKTDRFDALARNFYWLNVTRFFAGCVSKGELPSLVDRLQVLSAEDGFRYTDQPRVLASMLLSDWVFAQHPRSMRAVVEILLDDLAGRAGQEPGIAPLSLPEGSGRAELSERSYQLLAKPLRPDRLLAAAEILRANAALDTFFQRWLDHLTTLSGKPEERWLRAGLWTGALSRASDDDIAASFVPEVLTGDRLQLLFQSRKAKLLERNEAAEAWAADALLDGAVRVGLTDRAPLTTIEALGQGLSLLPDMYEYRHRAQWWHDDSRSELRAASETGRRAGRTAEVMREQLRRPQTLWATSLEPWTEIVECIRDGWGDRWLATEFAVLSAGIRAADEKGSIGHGFFDSSHELCQRARYARMRAGVPSWWISQLASAPRHVDQLFIASLFFAWASPKTVTEAIGPFNEFLARLRSGDLARLHGVTSRLNSTFADASRRVTHPALEQLPEDLVPDAAMLIAGRLTPPQAQAVFDRYLSVESGGSGPVQRRRATQLVNLASVDANRWPEALKAVAAAYAKGFVVPSRHRTALHGGGKPMPFGSAMEVIDNAARYPLTVVALAESAARAQLGRDIVPLATAAERDKWEWV